MTKNQLIKSIIDSLRNHRQYQQSRCEKDLQFAMQDKDFYSLEMRRRTLIKDLAMAEFEGDSCIDLQNEYNDTLKALNFRAEKLGLNPYNPLYNCNLCNDTGYSDNQLCKCVKNELFRMLKNMSGINNTLSHTFDKHNPEVFDGRRQESSINKLYDYLKKYSEHFPNIKYVNLILSGGTGTGKTYALSALGNSILEKGYELLYLTAFDMHNAFLRYHTSNVQDKYIHFDSLITADMLIIDDLGTEPIFRNVTKEYLYLVLEERMLNKLPTSISTNLSPDDLLERYGERIFSRLNDKRISRLINIDGDDIRRLRS